MGARIAEAVSIADDEGGELRAVATRPGAAFVARIEVRLPDADEPPYVFELDINALRELRRGLERIERLTAKEEGAR